MDNLRDWIKELFSLINYNGKISSSATTVSGCGTNCVPFIDTAAFQFKYGTDRGETRIIDSQFVSSTTYVSTVMNNPQPCVFGVNLADGRIKCYPQTKVFEVLYVRGTPTGGSVAYGTNSLADKVSQASFPFFQRATSFLEAAYAPLSSFLKRGTRPSSTPTPGCAG